MIIHRRLQKQESTTSSKKLYYLQNKQKRTRATPFLSIYLTLWDCTAILEALEKDCGLKSPRLVAIHVGFTEITRTDHHYVVMRSELQEETPSSSGEASVRFHGRWTLIAAAVLLMVFFDAGSPLTNHVLIKSCVRICKYTL